MAPKPGSSHLLRRGYLAPTEQVLFETRPSKWFYFPGPVAALIAFAFATYASATTLFSRLPTVPWVTSWIQHLVPASYAALPGPRTILLIVLLAAALASVVWLLARLYLWVGESYVVTDDRVIEEKGIVRTVDQEIPVHQIRNVHVFQDSWAARLLHYGTVQFKSLSQPDLPNETWVDAMIRSSGRPIPKSLLPNTEGLSIFDPRHRIARMSGVEWWVGVPSPVRIERMVELALRAPTTVQAVPPGRTRGAQPAPGA
jgi:hypothetical protein